MSRWTDDHFAGTPAKRWVWLTAIGLLVAAGAFLVGTPLLLAMALAAAVLWLAETFGIIPENRSPGREARPSALRRRVRVGFQRAMPMALAVGAFGAVDAVLSWAEPRRQSFDRGTQLVVTGGLAAVVFVTYFVIALAGYRVEVGGSSNAPRALAWVTIGLALIGIMGPVFYFYVATR